MTWTCALPPHSQHPFGSLSWWRCDGVTAELSVLDSRCAGCCSMPAGLPDRPGVLLVPETSPMSNPWSSSPQVPSNPKRSRRLPRETR